jgi:hypothetical protein
MKLHLFTPRTETGERLTLHVSAADFRKIRRGHWRATVTDQLSGRKYNARGAACSLPHCMCDAVVTEVAP